MSRGVSLMGVQVIFLVALQVASVFVLWLINPLTQAATDTFAIYLSMDLVAFAMLSYMYRLSKQERAPSQLWLSIGYLALVVLLVSNFTLG